MTGMVRTGTRGRSRSGKPAAGSSCSDEASSVVWECRRGGRRGAADKICPLPEIGQEIVRRVASRSGAHFDGRRHAGEMTWADLASANRRIEDRIRRRGSARSAYLKIRHDLPNLGHLPVRRELYCWLALPRRMSAVHAKTPAEYLEHLTVRGNREAELRLLLNRNHHWETYMFRSPPQLEALRSVILPQILKAKSAMGFKRLHLWRRAARPGKSPIRWPCFCWKKAKNAGGLDL